MELKDIFGNEYSLQKPNEEVFLQSGVPEWQQFYSQSKYQMQKDELFNHRILQFPPDTPTKNDMEYEDFSTKQNGTTTLSSPSSSYNRAENTDFLSAIPYARSSYTVKRKLNYEEESFKAVPKNVNNQITKTYFPFEFIGHATRKSAGGDVVSTSSDTKVNEKIIHPAMITGRALRRPDVNGSAFQTFTITNQQKVPTSLNKQNGKVRLKKRSKKQIPLERHVEQIRRKNAEFNWNYVNETQQKFGKCNQNNFPDLGNQRVPTSPFLERYTPPSLYSMGAEAPLNLVPWMQRPETSTNFAVGMQNYENRGNQHAMKESTLQEHWSENTQDVSENMINETKNFHLYPY